MVLSHRLGTFSVFRGIPEKARLSPTQDHLQLITFLSALATAPSYGVESRIEASVSANGASPVDSQFEPIQKLSTFQPVAQLVATGRRSRFLDRIC